MARNKYHVRIQDVIARFHDKIDDFDIEDMAENPQIAQLDHFNNFLFEITQTAAFKILHPLLIARYGEKSMHYQDFPIKIVGFDVETEATTGQPKLFGFAEDGFYNSIYKPTVATFFDAVDAVSTSRAHLASWGKFDIQIAIRLFDLTPDERRYVARGLSANVKENLFPCVRHVNDKLFYIASYIPGRSLKLGICDEDRTFQRTVWMFNISQFYPGTIAQTAKALGLDWFDYDRETHIIDWKRFEYDAIYKAAVLASNRQDAQSVQTFAKMLQDTFHKTFNAYPKLLVSHGSLTDASVSKLLSDGDEYQANSYSWLARNVWNEQEAELQFLEPLLTECFSAGYVDQFGLGYYGDVCTADISSAYPAVIRTLPDLRYSYLVSGTSYEHLLQLRRTTDVESAFIRGLVTIPESLPFHPITIKTNHRENYRPTGTFYAAYTLDERDFCLRYGAIFEDEDWCAVVLKKRELAPIATVSESLGNMRTDITIERDAEPTKITERYKFLDGQQYIVKVIDNSLYGKTVMSTEIIENVDGYPQITGYSTGDRFNLVYGCLITARTRVRLSEAMMAIYANGGRPIMAMTDSVYWYGSLDMLPESLCRKEKTPGFFEFPHEVTDFFILKTGQYEYKEHGQWEYKLRGLPVESNFINNRFLPVASNNGRDSLLRKSIKIQTARMLPFKHPKNVKVTLDCRRLHTIGQMDLEKVGLIESQKTDIRPFVLSGKQVERFIKDWKRCIDGHVWLETPEVLPENAAVNQAPLFFMRQEYEAEIKHQSTEQRERTRRSVYRRNQVQYWRKKQFCYHAVIRTHRPMPAVSLGSAGWGLLETHFGITRKELGL